MLNKFVSIGDSFSKHMGYEAFVGSSGIVVEHRESYSRVQIIASNEPSMMFTEVDIHNQDLIYEFITSSKYYVAFAYEDSSLNKYSLVSPVNAAFYISTNEDMLNDFFYFISENYSSHSVDSQHLIHCHKFKRMYDHDLLYSQGMFPFMKESVYRFVHFLSKNPDIQSTHDLPIIHIDDSTTPLVQEFFKHHGPYSATQYIEKEEIIRIKKAQLRQTLNNPNE